MRKSRNDGRQVVKRVDFLTDARASVVIAPRVLSFLTAFERMTRCALDLGSRTTHRLARIIITNSVCQVTKNM